MGGITCRSFSLLRILEDGSRFGEDINDHGKGK